MSKKKSSKKEESLIWFLFGRYRKYGPVEIAEYLLFNAYYIYLINRQIEKLKKLQKESLEIYKKAKGTF